MKRILHSIFAVFLKSLGKKIQKPSNLSLRTVDHFCQGVKMFACILYETSTHSLPFCAVYCAVYLQLRMGLSNSSQIEFRGGGSVRNYCIKSIENCRKFPPHTLSLRPSHCSETGGAGRGWAELLLKTNSTVAFCKYFHD